MPSGPDLFDDEDGYDPDRRPKPRPSELADPAGDDDAVVATGARRSSPNFLIRRAVVVGGVVAVLATASIVIGQLMGSDGGNDGSGAIGSDWNRIVLVDERTGRVIVDDVDGEELARIESGIRGPSDSAIVGSTMVVAGTDRVAVIDIAAESVDEYDLGADAVVGAAGSALTMIAPRSDGGRALLVHGPSGDLIDTDTFAPVVGARYEFGDARSSTSGRDLLVTDSGNFQSVLFSFDRADPSFFPGLALAVDNDLVVTAQNVGTDATINVFDHSGEPVSTGRTPSVRAGLITDDGIVLVTVDGAVVVMSSSNGDIAERGQLDIGTVESGTVDTSGERLVVTGASGTAIVDAAGETVATLEGQRPIDEGRPPAGSACLATTDTSDIGAQITVVDLIDGGVLVEADGDEPVVTDSSGCIAGVTTSDGYDLLSVDGVRQFQTGDDLLALSLDGANVAAERDGRVVLLDVADDDGEPREPIDLGPRGRTVHFTQS